MPVQLTSKFNVVTGLRVRKAREAAGFTQDALAKKSGIKQSVLSQIEAGRRNLKVEQLWRLAKAVSRKPSYFMP